MLAGLTARETRRGEVEFSLADLQDDESDDEGAPPVTNIDFAYQAPLPPGAAQELAEEHRREAALRREAGAALPGTAAFVALMLRCEEQQCVNMAVDLFKMPANVPVRLIAARLARQLGVRHKKKTAAEKLELAELRAKIDKLQEKIFADVNRFLPVTQAQQLGDASEDLLTGSGTRSVDSLGAAWDKVLPARLPSEEDVPPEETGDMPVDDEHILPELIGLPFPSDFGINICREQGWLSVFLTERYLRQAVMRDALENSRKGVGGKAYMFMKEHKHKKTTTTKTRAGNRLKQTNLAIQGFARTYSNSRKAWENLLPTLEARQEFRRLTPDDLKSVRAAVDHSARGSKQEAASWIWGGRLGSDTYVRACE